MDAAGMTGGRPRLLGGVLLLLGLLALSAAAFSDLVRGRNPSFGFAQALAAMVGVVLAGQGLGLLGAGAAERLTQWREARQRINTAATVRFAAVVLQLILFAAVVRHFQLENPAFYQQVVPLTVAGFVIHHLLPLRYRMAFFMVLSLTAIVLVTGVANAFWISAIIGLFIALAHLPVSFRARVALVLAAAVGLGVLRVMPERAPWSNAIWPIVSSILMFRLIVYLYDVKHAKQPIRLSQSGAYFFMTPNVVFPLFPVVDFSNFLRSHYDQDAFAIYQRGLDWILRGVVHLVLYRVIYQHFTLATSEVSTTGDLVQYMLSTFGLYLRVSGQFHLIVGMLHLFGFRLPETHHLFYLASSFTDFWRRINIYWKDFMMKVVFYPSYFPLRKKGETTALVLATLAVFFVTWVTHSYQWFWILGKWLLSWTDGLFWAILAVLLVANSLREAKKGRVRTIPGTSWSWPRAARIALSTAGTFTVICLLWSFWNIETVGEWLDLLSVRAPNGGEIAFLALFLGGLGMSGALVEWLERRKGAAVRNRLPTPADVTRLAVATAAGFAALLLAGNPAVVRLFGPDAEVVMRDLRVPDLNKRDAALLQRNYYEDLAGVGNQNSQLWELFAQRPAAGADIWQSGVLRDRPDFLAREIVPNFVRSQRGVTFRTNRWGMRDRDYELVAAPNTYRIAVLGQSYVAGDGVNDDETFEEVVEDELNEAPAPHAKWEILNFAVGSYSIPQQILLLERALTFRPRAVIVVGHPNDGDRAVLHIVQQMRRGVPPPWDDVRALVDSARVTGDLREAEAVSRLRPFMRDIMLASYRHIVRGARQGGASAAWVYIPLPERSPGQAEVAELEAVAREAGFTTLNLWDVYGERDLRTLQASPWDFHPNAEGHRVIAARFLAELKANPALTP